jgi:acyl-CoA synthetase (AMP-forming)/AMP-acid ligase II
VEAIIAKHPDVEKVAVVGLPDPRWGEAVTAAVVLRPDAATSPDEVRAFARERLAGYETPKAVFVVDALPLDFIGKVRKSTLKSMLLAKVESIRTSESD